MKVLSAIQSLYNLASSYFDIGIPAEAFWWRSRVLMIYYRMFYTYLKTAPHFHTRQNQVWLFCGLVCVGIPVPHVSDLPLLEIRHWEVKCVLHCSTTEQEETIFFRTCIYTRCIPYFQACHAVAALQSYTRTFRLMISSTFKTWGVFGFAYFLNKFKTISLLFLWVYENIFSVFQPVTITFFSMIFSQRL